VLVFVGLKMVWLNDAFGGKFPIGWSLAIIGGAIAASIVSSLFLTKSRAQQNLFNTEEENDVVLENRQTRGN
jgi:uncharacterized protein (DUF697 family)